MGCPPPERRNGTRTSRLQKTYQENYNADGVGDAGFETRFAFTFHSPVAAQMGPAGETPDTQGFWVSGDFDGDGKADPAVVDNIGLTVKLSSMSYATATLPLVAPQ